MKICVIPVSLPSEMARWNSEEKAKVIAIS